jgi:NADPH:quinone reductase-like Zn-dependent oxidoreductase
LRAYLPSLEPLIVTNHLDFLVNRSDWHATKFVEGSAPTDLSPGQVLFRIDRFAFTANNISYALSGDMIGYWRFFPTEEGWGRIPVMGFADVIASTHDEVAVGTRCFGFYPMSRYLTIEPGKVNASNISDGVAHRADIAAVYNQYSPVQNDGMYAADREDQMLLLRGLFMTSFLCDDLMADNNHYGAESVLITSASSKTSIALGYLVKKAGGAKAVGLTSERNLEFVKSLGCYDEVVTYDEVKSLPANQAVVMVDMAGNAALKSTLHHHFNDNMKYSCSVGATHWDATAGDNKPLPGAKPEFFFAPGQIAKRTKDWGPAGLQEKLGTAWAAFRDSTDSWLSVKRGYGRDAVEEVFNETLDANTSPAEGQIISLWDTPEQAAGK